ncbi:MAG: tRNA (adenosine(37)-N6)-threonylcarbamoyltransferase complex dimerization subunit type 1 TsaB [Treponema sp.]
MNIIVIDVAFKVISVLASGEKGVYSSHFYPVGNGRGKDLVNFIDVATKQVGFSVSETNIIALPEGPGGFTGLRLGYACAKAISLASGASVLAIPTLSIFDFSMSFWNGNLLAIIDAKRDCFYAQFFNKHEAFTEIYDAPIEEIISHIDKSKPCLVVGVGVSSFHQMVKEKEEYNNMTFIELSQNAFPNYILDYVINNRTLCKEVKDHEGPLYIRKSDAEM